LRARGVKNLVCCGVTTHVCVMSTVFSARHLDYRVLLPNDAVAGVSPAHHAAALLCMSDVFAYVTSTEEVVAFVVVSNSGKEPVHLLCPGAPRPIAAVSRTAVLHGDLLCVTGQMPIDPETGAWLRGSFAEQTHAVMRNLETGCSPRQRLRTSCTRAST